MTNQIYAQDCPRWLKCSAPVCPLEYNSNECKTLSNEPVCFYMLEAVKEGAETRFKGAGLAHIYARVIETLPELVATSGRLRRLLERSRKSGSRMDRRPPNQD